MVLNLKGKGRECSAVRFLALPLLQLNRGFVGPGTIPGCGSISILEDPFQIEPLAIYTEVSDFLTCV
jgi:hypothetical protein